MFGVMNCSATQINLPAVFVANGLGSCLLMVILYNRRKGLRIATRDGNLFSWMCRIALVLCILETCGFILEGKTFPGARSAALLCSAAVLLLAVLLAHLWVCYVDCKLFPNRIHARTNCYLAAIPAGLIGLMSLANLFTPVFFWVREPNLYCRTSLFLLPWVVVYSYMAWGALLSYRYQRRADKHLFIPVLMFLIPVYLGSLIQLFCYGISLIWASVALGLTFLYINLQREQAYLDPLTKLYNRSYLLHYVQHLAKQYKRPGRIVGIMLDINGFKGINDTLGHAEGDTVLKSVGRLLLRAAEKNTVIRYGGDEFVILLEDVQPEQVQTILTNIQQELRLYNLSRSPLPPISFSIGTAELDQKDVFRFFQTMDMKMYVEKRAFYQRGEIHEPSVNRS